MSSIIKKKKVYACLYVLMYVYDIYTCMSHIYAHITSFIYYLGEKIAQVKNS